MKRTRLILFAVLVVLLGILVFFFFKDAASERILPKTARPAQPPSAEPAGPGGTRTVSVFFIREADGLLVPELRTIPASDQAAREAEALLAELIKGSEHGALSAVPPGTKVRQVFVTKDGTAYADFSRELVTAHPSGTEAETATVYAIVNSLAFNFRTIKKVFILVDGEERETLSGHVMLDKPFVPNYALTAQS